jgi:hypothetical protein
MKYFFDLLYGESLRNGKPIVYLGHPSEFAPWSMRFGGRSGFFRRICVHGFGFRRMFCEKNERRRYEMNRDLLTYIQFMTVSDFVYGVLEQPGG